MTLVLLKSTCDFLFLINLMQLYCLECLCHLVRDISSFPLIQQFSNFSMHQSKVEGCENTDS